MYFSNEILCKRLKVILLFIEIDDFESAKNQVLKLTDFNTCKKIELVITLIKLNEFEHAKYIINEYLETIQNTSKGQRNNAESSLLDIIHDTNEFLECLSLVPPGLRLKTLSYMPNIPWSIPLIEQHKEYWDWFWLSGNQGLPWSIDLIRKYEKYWDWSELSHNTNLPWSIEFITLYQDLLDWQMLSGNKGIPWSIKLISHFIDKWYWEADPYFSLSSNSSLPFSFKLISRFEDRWDWPELSEENIGWDLRLIEYFKDKLDWSRLSHNGYLPWSLALIEKFEDKWVWDGLYPSLASNIKLPWTQKLLVKYKNKWNSTHISSLLKNKVIPWTIPQLNSFLRFDLGYGYEYLSSNHGDFWSEQFLEQHKEQF